MSHLIKQITQNRRQHIKKFESRVLNRSCADFMFYDKLADYLLQCCSAQAKPNTLSIFSLIPLIVCNLVIVPGIWWSYVIGIIGILMHQILDIANKKQAYRLSQFNLTTYYIDHLYDSISCIQIVDITAKLLLLQNETRLSCIFFFAILPFFTHHLAMYSNGYLTFTTISPAVQGLLLVKLIFLMCAIFPQMPDTLIFNIKISQIIIGLCMIQLIIFLIDDIRTITRMKKDINNSNSPIQPLPIKNLFVIGVLGYIIMQMAMIQQQLLNDSLFFIFNLGTLTLLNTFIISELVLSYGFEQKHRQFTLNILLVLFWIVLYYSICGWVDMDKQIQILIGRILFGTLFAGELIYFFYYHYSNVKYLNNIIKDE